MMIDEWWATLASGNFANEREMCREAYAAGLAAGLERSTVVVGEVCFRADCDDATPFWIRDEIFKRIAAERERTRGGTP